MDKTAPEKPRYAEFFCGAGMVRAGLGRGWDCVLANDIDAMKCATYRRNWGGRSLIEGDVADLDPAILQRPIDLYWASSPCQDFSLAGKGRGLSGARSGVFRPWLHLVQSALSAGFAPPVIAFENVVGLVSRHQGRDFSYVLEAFIALGYRVGALEIDAARFLPQSRPRLFVIALRNDIATDLAEMPAPSGPFHSTRLTRFVDASPAKIRQNWIWWAHEAPGHRRKDLHHLLDNAPDTPLFEPDAVSRLLAMMDPPSRARIDAALSGGRRAIGTLYRRGRPDETGKVRQRAEVRFDGIAGCLRTPAGGSSRQTMLIVQDGQIQARLLSSREAARLMGLRDSFKMPERYNDAYRVAGDGVAVPVVNYLQDQLFERLLNASRKRSAA